MSNTDPDQRTDKVIRSDAFSRAHLSSEQSRDLRELGTERSGARPLYSEERTGAFTCSDCAAVLFTSTAKFGSRTAWPGMPASEPALSESDDRSTLKRFTQVRRARGGGHLGHVFPDGPREITGPRYSINGVALKFRPEDG